MNKTAKVGTRSKTAVKPVKKAVKKRSAVSAAARKAVRGASEPMPEIVPLAEVEVLAAKAVKMIKAKRSVSPEEKAERLALVEEALGWARGWGGLSKGGAWDLKHPFGIMKIIDMEAVLR